MTPEVEDILTDDAVFDYSVKAVVTQSLEC